VGCAPPGLQVFASPTAEFTVAMVSMVVMVDKSVGMMGIIVIVDVGARSVISSVIVDVASVTNTIDIGPVTKTI
jgi:hypothetical protein